MKLTTPINLDFQRALDSSIIRRFFLKTNVNILVVVDRGIRIDDRGFGIGNAIDIVESSEFFPCANFKITCAQRSQNSSSINNNATSHEFKYTGFKFDMSNFSINDYDQVWFFGINPGNRQNPSDQDISQSSNSPLSNNELKILTKWMNEKNGGVLAMGDHHYLGASMCSKIPRVRNMRKWRIAQGVPSQGGFDRHDTNQAGEYFDDPIIPFAAQEDNTPQPIEVLQKVYSSGSLLIRNDFVPHPILCGVDGLIDILPDHPHEGETLGVRYDTGKGGSPVNLNLKTDIAGYNVNEYPDGISGHNKPQPEIIALARPINNSKHFKNNRPTTNPSNANDTTPFGLISVYDGEKAGVGRIVVDSTWHHWFNENLVGFDEDSIHYRKIRNYFKNVTAWLCRSSLRNDMMYCAIWDYLVVEYDPMRFSHKDSIWDLGVQAKDVLGRIASNCLTSEWILDFIIPELWEEVRFPPGPSPCLSCPPFEAIEIPILGGIMKNLLPLVEDYRKNGEFKRIKINRKKIMNSAIKGIVDGQKEYLNTFRNSFKRSNLLIKQLEKGFKSPSLKELNIRSKTYQIDIRLSSIVIHNTTLHVLLQNRAYSLIFELNVNGINIFSKEVLGKSSMKMDKNEFSRNGMYFKINKSIFKGKFEDGEELTINIFLTKKGTKSNERMKIWTKDFYGEVESWKDTGHFDFLNSDKEQKEVDFIFDIVGNKK